MIPKRIFVNSHKVSNIDGVVSAKISTTPSKGANLSEYISLDELWHSTKETPEYFEHLLIEYLDEDGITYETDWIYNNVNCDWFHSSNKIIKWCYIKDLLKTVF